MWGSAMTFLGYVIVSVLRLIAPHLGTVPSQTSIELLSRKWAPRSISLTIQLETLRIIINERA